MIVGVDYSMTCPAACIPYDAPQFWFASQRTYAPLSSITTHKITTLNVAQRAETTAIAFIEWLKYHGSVHAIVLENYAFSATGRVFHIGEHTGILKYLLWKADYPVYLVPPTVVKKFATGKGNADKIRMTSAFLKEYPNGQNWCSTFFPRSPTTLRAKAPLSDLADAYWIAKYGVFSDLRPSGSFNHNHQEIICRVTRDLV